MTSLWVWSIAIDAIETQRIKQGIKILASLENGIHSSWLNYDTTTITAFTDGVFGLVLIITCIFCNRKIFPKTCVSDKKLTCKKLQSSITGTISSFTVFTRYSLFLKCWFLKGKKKKRNCLLLYRITVFMPDSQGGFSVSLERMI